jgi:hypothetical protein
MGIDRSPIGTDVADDERPMASEQIARVPWTMGRIQPPDILDVAAGLDGWERKWKQHGIDQSNTTN